MTRNKTFSANTAAGAHRLAADFMTRLDNQHQPHIAGPIPMRDPKTGAPYFLSWVQFNDEKGEVK